MSKKINLYWYQYKQGHGNFGDELNPYIIERLTYKKVKFINIKYLFDDRWLAFKTISKAILRKEINVFTYLQYIFYNFIKMPEVLLVIGSILETSNSSKNKIWGAGFISSKTKKVSGTFYAVRGLRTVQKLRGMGYKAPDAIGDPALLLPIIYQPKVKAQNKIGIIPHYQHYFELKDKFGEEFTVINLLDPIEKVIDEISSCTITYSTSLHGIIVSHAYQVPSLWAEFPGLTFTRLVGDNIKFFDYFSSVGISDYSPLEFTNLEKDCFSRVITNELKSNLLPTFEMIQKRQADLLLAAPFEVIDKYRSIERYE